MTAPTIRHAFSSHKFASSLPYMEVLSLAQVTHIMYMEIAERRLPNDKQWGGGACRFWLNIQVLYYFYDSAIDAFFFWS